MQNDELCALPSVVALDPLKLAFEELEEGLASVRRGFPPSPLELKCGGQGVAMLVRQRPERLAALHARDGGVDIGATCKGGRANGSTGCRVRDIGG